MPSYEDRVVLFLDVLGWSSALEASADDDAVIQQISDVAEEIAYACEYAEQVRAISQHLWDSGKLHEMGNPKRIQYEASHFSDTVVYSCVADGQVGSILGAAGALAVFLLQKGYYVRGAIARGPLHHTSRSLFGPALVQAYRLEKKIAIYPRIIVTPEVDDLLDSEILVRTDPIDGVKHLNYLHPSQAPAYMPGAFDQIRSALAERRRSDSADPHVMQKHIWFLNYLNTVCPA